MANHYGFVECAADGVSVHFKASFDVDPTQHADDVEVGLDGTLTTIRTPKVATASGTVQLGVGQRVQDILALDGKTVRIGLANTEYILPNVAVKTTSGANEKGEVSVTFTARGPVI